MIQYPRLIISGLGGDNGKTVISTGLCRLWYKESKKVIPFKKGPDYIDMAWLSYAAKHPCYNLDLFLMSKDDVKFSFSHYAKNSDISVIEGNRGLYDGMDEAGSVSTAEIAKLLHSPVIIVVDCTKVTRTVAALILGCQMLDPNVSIKGVILNKLAGYRHESIIRKSIEFNCGLSVCGAIPRLTNIIFPGRHLGLVPPQEYPEAEEAIENAASIAKKYLDLEKLWEIAHDAPPLLVNSQPSLKQSIVNSYSLLVKHSDKFQVANDQLRVGVIRDSAFQFYYQENLDALKKEGVELIEFSSLIDDLPSDIDALYIGGGFPETHAEQLSSNAKLRHAIKIAAEEGLPIYAECGGLIYLSEKLIYGGKSYDMTGVLPIVIGVSKKPVGHGYTVIEVEAPNPFFKIGLILHGHEFHYSHVFELNEISHIENGYNVELESGMQMGLSTLKDGIYFAFKINKGVGIINRKDGLCYKNVLATYTHLHALGAKEWVKGMIQAALENKKTSN